MEITPWTLFIKRQIIDATIYNVSVIVHVTIRQKDLTCAQFWGHLHALSDQGRAQYLWNATEFDELVNKLEVEMKRNKSAEGAEQQYQLDEREIVDLFQSRIVSNLKIILSVDSRNSEATSFLGRLFCSI